MPGYMSDTNEVFRWRYEAEGSALWWADSFRGDWNIDENRCYYKVEGNKHEGYEIYRRDTFDPREVYMTIKITECFEDDCLEEMEE